MQRPILRAPISNRSGFTLIEILIVLTLIALITAISIPSLNSVFRTSSASFAKQFALLLREARDRALLSDKLVRLHLDLEKQEFFLEEAPSSYLLPKEKESERKEDQKKPDEAFRLLKELTKEKRPIPKGIKLVKVISPRSKSPIQEGSTDIYFFSNGNADGARIVFESDDKTQQTVWIHPITGLSKIKPGGGEAEEP